jgi:hypothetical protein
LPHDACSKCDAPAPKVKTAGTMADLGWRMQMIPATGDRPMRVEWLCPQCGEKAAGSAPLSKSKAKGG